MLRPGHSGRRPIHRASEQPLHIPAIDSRDQRHWVRRINALLRSEKASFVTLARVLHEAREELQAAGWDQLWATGQINCSRREAEMLLAMGRQLAALGDPNSARLLRHWNLGFDTALLEGKAMARLVSAGVIRRDFSLCDPARLRRWKSNPSSERAISRLEEMARQEHLFVTRKGRAAWAAALKRVADALFPEP